MPGITTLTAHARYYTLHGLIAAEAEAKNLVPQEARVLLRRAEVAMAGVSLAHMDRHPGMSAPHGGEKVAQSLKSGALDVAGLAGDRRYADAQWGFWGPYLGSEAVLGLVRSVKGTPRPGEHLDVSAVRTSLGDLLELARQDSIDLATLKAHGHVCMCQAGSAADGTLLQERLLPSTIHEMHSEDRRSQTLRLLLRVMDMHGGVQVPQRDLSRLLAFDQAVSEDSVVLGFHAYPAWVGVVLRSLSVAAWRDLWSWLVKQIAGFMPIPALCDVLAQSVPDVTVKAFLSDLPALFDEAGRLENAEFQVPQSKSPEEWLAILCIGALRVGTLESRVAAYFEGADERWQQLTPTWMRERLEEWLDRPLRDFAVFLANELVARSQRLALSKAAFNKKTGRFTVPTRVFVREGFIYRDSTEGGGGISLRFNTATTVMAGIGLVERTGDRWVVTDRGRIA